MVSLPQPKIHAPRWCQGTRGTALYLGLAAVAWAVAGILQHGWP